MKNLFRLMAMAIVVMAFAACGSNSATPKGAVDSFLKSYQKGDYAALIEKTYFKKELSEEDKAQFAEVLSEKAGAELEKKGGLASYEIGDVKMAEDGKSAKVEYTLHYGNGTQKEDDEKVILVDGKWLIDSGK